MSVRKLILTLCGITAAFVIIAGNNCETAAAWQKYAYGRDQFGKTIKIYENGCIVQDGALIGCVGGQSEVVVPDGVREISYQALDVWEDTNWIGYDDQGKKLIMRSQWKDITKITAPESVRRIKDKAFNHSDLREAVVPASTKLEGNPFQICEKLFDKKGFVNVNNVLCDIDLGSRNGTIVVPEGVERIAAGIEAGEVSDIVIDALILPKSLRRVDSTAFFSVSIHHLAIQEGLEWLSDNAFENCPIKYSLHIPDSLKYIGNKSLRVSSINLKLNENFFLPPTVEFWGDDVFYNFNKNWDEPKGPNNDLFLHMRPGENFIFQKDRLIGYADSFDYTKQEQEIKVPKGARIIGSYAFASNGGTGVGPYKRKIIVPEGVVEIEADAFSCPAVKEVALPETLQKIGDRSFQNSEITEAAMYEGLTLIGDGAFENTKLKSVSIPETVESVGDEAFMDCRDLKSVNASDRAILGEAAFKGCDGLADDEGLVIVNGVLFDAYLCQSKKLSLNQAKISSISKIAFIDASDLHYVYVPEEIKLSEQALSPNIVYFGADGSATAEAAKECGAAYIAVKDEAEFNALADLFVIGEDYPNKDVNNDGKVTLDDAQLSLCEALGIAHGERLHPLKIDTNGDGKVTLLDALAILEAALGIE